MVRTTSRAPSVGQSSVSKIRDRRSKKAYKVQLESVVTKKKKLKLKVCQYAAYSYQPFLLNHLHPGYPRFRKARSRLHLSPRRLCRPGRAL